MKSRITDSDIEFMRKAIEISQISIEEGGGPFGAVIVQGGIIVSTGNNRVTKNNDPTAHAEIEAIRDACKKLGKFKLSNCTIYTSCEPCPMCLGAIYWAGIKRVFSEPVAENFSRPGRRRGAPTNASSMVTTEKTQRL